MLEPTLVKKEMVHLQRHFRVRCPFPFPPSQADARPSVPSSCSPPLQDKRDFVVSRLREMGFVIKYMPDSTFYM